MNGNDANVPAVDTRPDRGDSAFDPSVDRGRYAPVPTIDPNWVSLTRFKIRTALDDNSNNSATEYVFRNGRQQARFYIDIEARNQNGEVVAVSPAYLKQHLKLIRRDDGVPLNFWHGMEVYSPVPRWWPSLESYVERSEDLGAAWSVHAPDEEMEREASVRAESPDVARDAHPSFRWLPADDGGYWPLQEYVITAATSSELREWVAVSLLAPNGTTLYTTNDLTGGAPGKFRSFVRFVSLPLYSDAVTYSRAESFLGDGRHFQFCHFKLTIQLHGHAVNISHVADLMGRPFDLDGSHTGKSHALIQCTKVGDSQFDDFQDLSIESLVTEYENGDFERIRSEEGAQSFLGVHKDEDLNWGDDRIKRNGSLFDIYGTEHAIKIRYDEPTKEYRVERA